MPFRAKVDVEEGRTYRVDAIEGVKVSNAPSIRFPLNEDILVRTGDMADTVVVNKRTDVSVKINSRASVASDCPEDVVPTFGADPTHMLYGGDNSIGATVIAIVDNTDALVRNLVSGRNNIGHPWVDYPTGRVYWMERDGGDNSLTLRRIDADGSDEAVLVTLADTGPTNEANHVFWDDGAGKFLLHASDAQYTCNKDGSDLTVVDTFINLGGIYPYNDGVHFVEATGTGVIKVRLSDGGQADGIDGSGSEVGFFRDIANSRAFYVRRFSLSARLEYVNDADFTDTKTIVEQTDYTNTTLLHIKEKDRWLYYQHNDGMGNLSTKRRHLDDLTKVETVFTFLHPNFWPWNE